MDKRKVFNIIYAIAITALFSGMLMALYNVTFAYAGSAPTKEHLFSVTNIFCIVLSGLTFATILLNVFFNEKLFWVEIITASVSVVVLIVFIALGKKATAVSAFQSIWFELVSSFVLLIISRLCCKFLNRQATKNIQAKDDIDSLKDTKIKRPKSIKKSLITFVITAILFLGTFLSSLGLSLHNTGKAQIALLEPVSFSYYSYNNQWEILVNYELDVTHSGTYNMSTKLYRESNDVLLRVKNIRRYIEAGNIESMQEWMTFDNTDDGVDYSTEKFYIEVELVSFEKSTTTQNYVGYILIPIYLTFAGFAIYYLIDFVKLKKKIKING